MSQSYRKSKSTLKASNIATKMDFSLVCRLCAGGENLEPLFAKTSDFASYSKSIFTVTGVKISPDDGLPQKICTVCSKFILQALRFRRKCQETDIDFRDRLPFLRTKLQCGTSDDADQLDVKPFTKKNINSNTKKVKKTTNSRLEKGNKQNIKITFDNEKQENIKKENFIKMETSEEKFVEIPIKSETVEITIERDDSGDSDSDVSNKSNDDDVSSDDDDDDVVLVGNEGVEHKRKGKGFTVTSLYTPKENNRVVCNLCDKELSIHSRHEHTYRFHNVSGSCTPCELCGKNVRPQRLRSHTIRAHGGRNGVKCRFCKIEYKTKEELKEHITTCPEKKPKRKVYEGGRVMQECDICHLKMQKASLRLHKAVQHRGLKPVCQHCGRGFGNKNRLIEHCRAKHGYEKLRCPYCPYVTAFAVSLKVHERRHRGEKPFVCSTCGAGFHAPYLLTQHYGSHITEKTVQCDLCPSVFKSNNSLHNHKAVCHNQNMYRCHLCSRLFRCRQYAVKHLRLSHSFTGKVPKLDIVPNTSQ